MASQKIKKIFARWILDSRGNPTVEAEVTLRSGAMGRASVPSGASTGSKEAIELRDGDAEFGGKGVKRAVHNITQIIAPKLIGENSAKQDHIDRVLLELDGTKNKSRLGANATLAVSLATAKAFAYHENQPLYAHIAQLSGVKSKSLSIPVPMTNLMNGGRHASFASDFQEYMIVPSGIPRFPNQLQACSEIFAHLGELLKSKRFATTVGDEGGYAPKLPGGNEAPLEIIVQAISAAGYEPGKDIFLALDVAASEFYKDGIYNLKSDQKKLSSKELYDYYQKLLTRYPIMSIEDGFFETDYEPWEHFVAQNQKLMIVGDDLLVTNPEIIEDAIRHKRANALLVKPNQIGTLTETIKAVSLAHSAGWKTVMSHRSGETEDASLAHLAVGMGTSFIKAGSMSRSERLAKYNELLRINENL